MVATLITTWLSKKGKLKIYIMQFKNKYETYEDTGCSKGGKLKTDFYGNETEIDIEIYNTSGTPKIMRNIKLKYYKNKKEQYSVVLKDEESRRTLSYMTVRDNVEVMNFQPKQVVKLKLYNYIHEDELDKIEGCDRVSLTYIDERNKKQKVILNKEIITTKNYVFENKCGVNL